ncbi:tyrosine-type recombinase/integrase [Longimicrobium sp.]|uniref:tyrosine-type recombinase/integrase n=1 Tax=Longimicrobium sp. TaxID=2029185 RepID=UPI002E32DA25|nr:tyrosine-type recombinase/integrase [Longimicrobium sp.]HEX6041298.1 tyrosine-type recombinase/integrase [Longimicrobium sp.]
MKENSRIRWRDQGGQLRAYADLRDLGGRQRALIPRGETRATTDPEIAEHLLVQRMHTLLDQRRDKVLLGLDPDADLAEFADHHLRAKAKSGEYLQQWLTISRTYLDRAIAYFTQHQYATETNAEPEARPRNLATISVVDVGGFVDWLATQPNGRGGVLGPASRRLHLSALSGLFRRAISEGKLPIGSNPVSALIDKPRAPKSQTSWLEVGELALLLESARALTDHWSATGQKGLPTFAYEFLATFILTGAREGEIRRLLVTQLDFDSLSVYIPGTKTDVSERTMPMHPQLAEILLPHVQRLGRNDGLVFTTASGAPVGDWRKILDAIATRAGFPKGQIRTRVFRTSYITHRLACIDQGAPIDPYQVAREVGHSSLAMIMKVYGRVQRRRVRMEELAFRTEVIGPHLQSRLQALYSPPPPAERKGAAEAAMLVQGFLAATARMTTGEICTATDIPRATVNRIRAGKQATIQGKTKSRMIDFLHRLGEPSAVSDPSRK